MFAERFGEVHLSELENKVIAFDGLVSLGLITWKPAEVPDHAILVPKSVDHSPFFSEQVTFGSRVLFEGELVMLSL